MSHTDQIGLQFREASPAVADAIGPLIYDSAHELLDFMFGGRERAEAALGRLLRIPRGHFGYGFAETALIGNQVVGVSLGYDKRQLASQELYGTINMFRAAPWSLWPHLVTRVGPALSGYVPPPSGDAFYINNIAVDTRHRGTGLGRKLLDHVIERARGNGYRCVELDVTERNTGALRFYERYGFRRVSQSGSEAVTRKYGLPVLRRMRFPIDVEPGCVLDNEGRPTSTTVVNDVTGLNPVQVDEVYAPGSVEQLRAMLRSSDKPVSIGGGRYSMGGQTAARGTLHIDMRGLNRVLEIDAGNKTVRVQAGARWKDVQRAVDDHGLAVKVMQTYSNFTVGGSLSVNCHGRYVGLGPLILSVRSISVLLQDGELVKACSDDRPEIFYAMVGGYGALGIIVEAELKLAENDRIERVSRKMTVAGYPQYFSTHVRSEHKAVFHNADMVPPDFKKVRAITWLTTDKPVNTSERKLGRKLYLAEKYMLWAITETPAGHVRREYVYETLLYWRPKITFRNDEADYDVAELEPLSRNKSTYILQEYFVPVDRLSAFTVPMANILRRYAVRVVNVSIRHAHQDPGSLLAWAREEVFALVLYYKQGTSECECESVGVWTRELIDAVLACGGTYYLPYQPHARTDQFHLAYPRARELFALKDRLDPGYRFRNCLWDKYYRNTGTTPLPNAEPTRSSAFLSVYGSVESRDAFYRFLQTVYHLYPEDLFHNLIRSACRRHDDDRAIYEEVARRLPDITPFLRDFRYALPALMTQKKEMRSQTVVALPGGKRYHGYLEIGSTGRYVKGLKKSLGISGEVYLTHDSAPDYSPPEIMERGGLKEVGRFFLLDDYTPIDRARINDESLDLVTCYIGLHHCPQKKLAAFIASIHRVLRPGGCFVLRDHDAGSVDMRTFCSLVHTVFNAGLGVSWEDDCSELRLFEGVDYWVNAVTSGGFADTGHRLLQANDPSLNTLMCFVRQ